MSLDDQHCSCIGDQDIFDFVEKKANTLHKLIQLQGLHFQTVGLILDAGPELLFLLFATRQLDLLHRIKDFQQ
ncbi:hypothetical protein D3C79_370040 [compost metagenome]